MALIEVSFSDVDREFSAHDCHNPWCVHGDRLMFGMPEKPGVFTFPMWVECDECGMRGPRAFGMGHVEHYDEALEYWNNLSH